MTGKQQQKTVTIRSKASGDEGQEVSVRPGQTPREALADAVGRDSEDLLLRKDDQYLAQDREVYEQVREGDELIAASNPKVGGR